MAQSTFSLDFDGTGQVSTGYNGSSFFDFAASCWVKVASYSGFQLVLDGGGLGVGGGWAIYFNPDGTLHFAARSFGFDSSVAPTTGDWHYIAIIGTGGTLTGYVDGVSVGSVTFDFIVFGGRPLYMGQQTGGSGFPLTGQIDDVAVWDNAGPSPTDIAAIYAGTTDLSTLSPTGLWRLEEGTGTTASDSSGNANAGTLSGGVTWSNDVPAPLAGGGVPPAFGSTAALDLVAQTIATTSAHTPPAFGSTALLDLFAQTIATTSAHTPPAFGSTALLDLFAQTIATTSAHTPPALGSMAALQLVAQTFAASADFASASPVATAALATEAQTFAAVASFTAPPPSSTAALALGEETFSGSATFTPPASPTEDETVAAIFVHDGKATVIGELAAYIDDELTFGLFKNDLVPTEDTDLGDVVDADFAGYAHFATTWGAVTFDADGRAIRVGAVITWNCTGGGVTNVIFGFYVTNAGAELQFIHRFAAPRSMAVSGDEISVLPTFLVGNLAPP